jgi:uncharacterized protein YkwD
MPFFPRTPRGPEIVRRRGGQNQRARAPQAVRPGLEDLEQRWLLASAIASAVQPTAAAQYMLELINQARANPAAFGQQLVALAQTDPLLAAATRNWDLNQFLQVIDGFGPEPPLAFNTGLIAAADDHDAAMLAANGQFHSPPGYLNNPQVATDAEGQVYYPTGITGWATGENVFAYSSNVPPGSSDQAYAAYFNAAFFLDWGNSDFGHLKNLLAPGPAEASPGSIAFSEIGIGLMTGVTPTTPPNPNNPVAANRGLNVGPDIMTQEFGWRAGNAFLTGVVYVDSDHNNFYTPGAGLGGITIAAVGRNGQGTFQTQTWDSGGYSLALPPGTYTVAASGGSLPAPQTTTITIGQDNVPWSIPLPATAGTQGPVPAPAAASSSGASPSTAPVAVAPSTQDSSSTGTVTVQALTTAKGAHHPIHHHAPRTASRPVPVRVLVRLHHDHAIEALGQARRIRVAARPGLA